MEESAYQIQNAESTTSPGMEDTRDGELSKGSLEGDSNAKLCAHKEDFSGQTWIPIHDCPLSESSCKLLNRVVPNGTLRGVEGESQISPIRSSDKKGSVSDRDSGDRLPAGNVLWNISGDRF